MESRGIRIFDASNNVLTLRLSDVLEEIFDGDNLNWCILFLDGTPSLQETRFFNKRRTEINRSKSGVTMNWEEVCLIDKQFDQIFETTILGAKTYEFLHRYGDDREMYRSCDIAIELIDCSFWQIFSQDHQLISNLKKKFKETELLELDFEK